MDLGAYAQIDELEKVMADNDIQVPRLRGIRLMSEEKPLAKEEIEREARSMGLLDCQLMIEGHFVINPRSFELSRRIRRLKRKYLILDKETGDAIDVSWKNVHGKRRKLLKYALRMAGKRVRHQYEVWNRYAGRKDILYIHARIGGNNWPHYRAEVDTKPWFIEKVNDASDSTYCDIYARIDPNTSAREEDCDEV